MTSRLRKHESFLRRLLVNPKAVNYSTNDQIAILIEITYNAIRGNLKLKFSMPELIILRRELTLLAELAYIRDAKLGRKVFKRLPLDVRESLIQPALALI